MFTQVKLKEETQEFYTITAELSQLKETVDHKNKSYEIELAKLKAEIKRLTTPVPHAAYACMRPMHAPHACMRPMQACT